MTEPIDRDRLLRELVGHYIDLPTDLTLDGLICRGFVAKAAAVLSGATVNGATFLDDVDFAFRGLVAATEEHAAFEADPEGYLDRLGMSRTAASVTSTQEILDRNLAHWTDRLGSLQPVAKVVGL